MATFLSRPESELETALEEVLLPQPPFEESCADKWKSIPASPAREPSAEAAGSDPEHSLVSSHTDCEEEEEDKEDDDDEVDFCFSAELNDKPITESASSWCFRATCSLIFPVSLESD